MAKKAGGGAPAWMATFADLMSLLLTLFVLLLTFAEMDVIKYKAIAGSMANAFGVSRKDQLSGVIEIDGSIRRKAAADVDMSKRQEEIDEPPSTSTVTVDIPQLSEEELEERAKKVREGKAEDLKKDLSDTMQQEIKDAGVVVERKGDEVVIRFPSEIAFPSGSGDLNTEFMALLDRLAPTLDKTPGSLVVSGHTDNIPIRGGRFESNWDLSAIRATAVVHHFLFEHLLDPTRVTVQGYGDSRPIASNDTPEGRRKNRRVEVSIVAPEEDAAKAAEMSKEQKTEVESGFYGDNETVTVAPSEDTSEPDVDPVLEAIKTTIPEPDSVTESEADTTAESDTIKEIEDGFDSDSGVKVDTVDTPDEPDTKASAPNTPSDFYDD